MSDDHQLYYHHGGDHNSAAAFFPYNSYSVDPSPAVDHDPYYNMSFTDCLHGSVDYTSLSKAFSLDGDGGGGNTAPPTPISSGSFSSEEDSGSICNNNGNNNNNNKDGGGNQNKGQGKGSESAVAGGEEGGGGGDEKAAAAAKKEKAEKRKKEARFAFMTKSEVDHLEDGYRWRKYGQKAVKNSPYPRSYYRCTTQKCGVKKRVERSFEDPSTVITTYEGQHNHPLPSTLRGNAAAAAAMFSHSILTTPSAVTFPADFLLQMSSSSAGGQSFSASPSASASSPIGSTYTYEQNYGGQQYYGGQNVNQLTDYGLLQDVVPNSMFFKQAQ